MTVLDPFDAAADPALPSVALALDPGEVQHEFERHLPRLVTMRTRVRARAIRVTRHKPGRRCVVEYDLRVERPDAPPETVTLLGKIRVGRYGKAGYRQLDAFWRAGFGDDSTDGISVPEPIGAIGRFRMWLQRKVPGRPATELLAKPGGVELGRRIAEVAHKIHTARVPPDRTHGMVDELRILHDCLGVVARTEPRWADRLERVLGACDRLGSATPCTRPVGIHRDFYADQVIVARNRLYAIDFDLYCAGDPGLDIGNFLGHVTEQSLRTLGNPEGLAAVERAMEERFVELSGEQVRPSVRAYATLTLVRHIYLSTRFADRRHLTHALLELCEERLAAWMPSRAAAAW